MISWMWTRVTLQSSWCPPKLARKSNTFGSVIPSKFQVQSKGSNSSSCLGRRNCAPICWASDSNHLKTAPSGCHALCTDSMLR